MDKRDIDDKPSALRNRFSSVFHADRLFVRPFKGSASQC